MPLALVAYLTLCAGLALGFAAPHGATVAVGALTLATVVRRDLGLGALALTLAAGALAARAHGIAAARCAAAARSASTLDAVLLADAAPGARATAQSACGLPLTVLVANGRASAGDHVHVQGDVVPGARGALVRAATVTPTGTREVLAAWRAHTGRVIDALFGDDAPLARALVVADESALRSELRDRYSDAGLVHLLSVSGLHVSLVAAALELLLGAARLSRRAASAGAALGVVLYVAAIGAPAPAVRAGTMLAAQLAAKLLQRRTSPWAVLAIGGTVPLLVDASAVLAAGYQLSMGGMASLVAGRALVRRNLTARLPRWKRVVAREIAVSVVATVVTAPVVAWWFGRLSLVGPLANLAASPIVALLQPTLFLALVLAPARPLALHVAGAVRLLMRALDAVAGVAAGVPNAAIAVAPSAVTLAWCALAATALLVASGARSPWVRTRAALVAAAAVAAAVVLPLAPVRPGAPVELHMLDVGQGDAVALRTPRGRWILVDAGRTWRGGDAGRSTVLPYLRRRGGALALFVLSHPHADHVGGAASILAAMRPPLYWDAAFALGSDTYRGSLDAARRSGVAWHRVHPDDSLAVDGVVLRVLAPDSAWTANLVDPNLASVVLSVRFGEVRFLLVGDAEAPEERWLVERAARDPSVAAALRADVLKVAHHGSRTSSVSEFLALVRPRVALVSVGAGNSYHLPNADVLDRLAGGGAEVLRTDQWGPIVVRTDGRRLDVDAGGSQWTVPSAGFVERSVASSRR